MNVSSILTASRPDSILRRKVLKKLRHSLSLMSATTEMIYSKNKNFGFINALWNAKLKPCGDDCFDPYYDACCIYSA